MSFPGALCKAIAAFRLTLGQVPFLELRPALLILPSTPTSPPRPRIPSASILFVTFKKKVKMIFLQTTLLSKYQTWRTISTYILKSECSLCKIYKDIFFLTCKSQMNILLIKFSYVSDEYGNTKSWNS